MTDLLQADDPIEDAPAAVKRARKGWARGYQPPEEARAVIKSMSRTRLGRSALTAGLDLAALLGLAVGGARAWRAFPGVGAAAASVAAVLLIGRFGRAQECMVHESSHRNWSRSSRWNDVLANLLSGYPTASRVSGYRAQHVIHHAHLGSPEDPDIQRYEEYKLEELTGLGGWRLVRAIGRRLPRYNWGWYTTIGTNPVTMAVSGAWYLVVFAAVALAAGSVGFAAAAWLHWLLGYALVLPVIRMIGEAGEHRYLAGDTVFNATISNLGWAHKWIVHPHGDGHHTLHHLWSSVPHHRIRRMHDSLATMDRDGYGGGVYWRARVLERVRQGLPR